MRDIMVKFTISTVEEKRLHKIAEEYGKCGLYLPEDELFATIIKTGSKYDIDEKFRVHERKLGLVEHLHKNEKEEGFR